MNHLARQIDNKQLFDTFSIFGNILSCKVSVNAKRESLGYGFVHYETEESARTAIERVDGKVKPTTLTVRWCCCCLLPSLTCVSVSFYFPSTSR